MFASKNQSQLGRSSLQSQLGTMLYLLGALLLTGGSFYGLQSAPEIFFDGLVLGTMSSLFIVYSLLGLILSKKFGAL